MSSNTAPIATTTTFSLILHGAVAAMLFSLYGQSIIDAAVGDGVEIELVSSTWLSNEKESNTQQDSRFAEKNEVDDPVIESANTELVISTDEVDVLTAKFNETYSVIQSDEQKFEISEQEEVIATVAQSTNASESIHSITELLHSRIGDNKKYPYLARRQGREGVSRITFMLHPDGSIENTRLVTSSETLSLDQAALTAVRSIEPFVPAQQYLDHAESFNVDVVFNLL